MSDQVKYILVMTVVDLLGQVFSGYTGLGLFICAYFRLGSDISS
jgi:hypothetical protein